MALPAETADGTGTAASSPRPSVAGRARWSRWPLLAAAGWIAARSDDAVDRWWPGSGLGPAATKPTLADFADQGPGHAAALADLLDALKAGEIEASGANGPIPAADWSAHRLDETASTLSPPGLLGTINLFAGETPWTAAGHRTVMLAAADIQRLWPGRAPTGPSPAVDDIAGSQTGEGRSPARLSAPASSHLVPPARRGRKPTWDRAAFHAEALRFLDDNGVPDPAVDPGFRQADVEAHLARWSQRRYGREPDTSWLRRQIVGKAIAAHRTRRAAEGG